MRIIPWETTQVLVEYGPGVGTLTLEMLQYLRPEGRIVAIEQHATFVRHLRQSIHDPRLQVVHGSAEDIARVVEHLRLPPLDCIVSGIPYSTIPAAQRDSILRQSCRVLRRGGLFLVYQFTGTIVEQMECTFGAVQQYVEFRNFLPARIFSACKR